MLAELYAEETLDRPEMDVLDVETFMGEREVE